MKRKLFILAEPRSGSSWLMNTLNSHQNIALCGELFNHATFPGTLDFHNIHKDHFPRCIDYLENKLPPATGSATHANKNYTGCKILLNQLHLISADFPAYFIETYNDSHFIFLYRENTVAAHISLKIAHTHKTWHITESKDIIKRTVHINPRQFFSHLQETRQQREDFQELLKRFSVNHIALTYENLFTHKEKTMADISAFLQIPHRGFRFSTEKKGNPFHPQEILENFEELKQFFKEYPDYEEMLLKGGEE